MVVSADAAALTRAYQAALRRYRIASVRCEEAEHVTVDPKPPEELFARGGDLWLLRASVPDTHYLTKRAWYGSPQRIGRLREETFRYMSGEADRKAVARRDEIVGTYDEWIAALQAGRDAFGLTAAEAEWGEADADLAAVRSRLITLRTSDPDIMALKAVAFFDLIGANPQVLDDVVGHDLRSAPSEEAMASSLVRDFIGLLPTARQVAA